MDRDSPPPPPKSRKALNNQLKDIERKKKLQNKSDMSQPEKPLQINEAEERAVSLAKSESNWLDDGLKIQKDREEAASRMRVQEYLQLESQTEEKKLAQAKMEEANKAEHIRFLREKYHKKAKGSSSSTLPKSKYTLPDPKFTVTPTKKDKGGDLKEKGPLVTLVPEYKSDTD